MKLSLDLKNKNNDITIFKIVIRKTYALAELALNPSKNVTTEACKKIYNNVAVYFLDFIFKILTATLGINITLSSIKLQFKITSIIYIK
jgi:hypothetical protein